MRVRSDQRSREVHPAPGAERAAREARHDIAEAEVRAAKALATIERSRSYVRRGFASVDAWAADVGFGPRQTWRLLALGRTLVAAPELDARVRSGSVPAESAASVGKVLLEPAIELNPEERREWLRKTWTVPPRALHEQAVRAVEEARQGEPTLPLRFLVTKAAKDGFHRARLLMSKGEPRWITEGETFGRLVRDWLLVRDPRMGPLPSRRSGPTQGRRSRYVPRKVAAIVERRSGGQCEICRVRRATQKIHARTPHARGGSREPDNIADACGDCHVLVDAGVFAFSHFDKSGRPQWDFHPGSLYGELGSGDRPSRVREGPSPRYPAIGSRATGARSRNQSTTERRQRAPPFS